MQVCNFLECGEYWLMGWQLLIWMLPSRDLPFQYPLYVNHLILSLWHLSSWVVDSISSLPTLSSVLHLLGTKFSRTRLAQTQKLKSVVGHFCCLAIQNSDENPVGLPSLWIYITNARYTLPTKEAEISQFLLPATKHHLSFIHTEP